MDLLRDSFDSLNFCLLFFSFWWIALRKPSSFLLMGDGRDELSEARFPSGMSRESFCLRRAVLLFGCLEESGPVGEESELPPERDKTGLMSSAVAIPRIVAIVETLNGCFSRFTAPLDPNSLIEVSVFTCVLLGQQVLIGRWLVIRDFA